MKKIENQQVCDFCIQQSDIFRHLTQEEFSEMSYNKSCNLYKRGDVVYHEGNRVNGIYCIGKGIVKHYKTGIDGKEQIVRFSKKGGIFGFRSILSEEVACTTTKVIEDASICFIPSEQFIYWLKHNSDFSMKMMKLSCKELGEANQYIIDIAQKSVRERLAEILLLLNDNFGTDAEGNLNISLTREEIAGLVGTATESVIRLLSEFKADNLIELDRRHIKLLNIKQLKRICDVF